MNYIKPFAPLKNTFWVMKGSKINPAGLKYGKNTNFTCKTNFTPEEINDAIGKYVRTNQINEALRNGCGDKFKRTTDTLDYAIKTAKPLEEDTLVFRGLQAPEDGLNKEILEKYINNNPGYTSMTTDSEIAYSYKNRKSTRGALAKIILPKGTKCIKNGKEFIVGRFSKFEFLNDNIFEPFLKFIMPKN